MTIPVPEDASPLEIKLDPNNPRFAREGRQLSQEDILHRMIKDLKLAELGESIVSAGFITIDPLIAYKEKKTLIVIEGNRRIATLQLLIDPDRAPKQHQKAWKDLAARLPPATKKAIEKVSVQVFPSREDADLAAYIGFRHVTGTVKWPAFEKASYIAHLIEDLGWSYGDVAEKTGSKGRYIEQHYVALKLALQARTAEIDGADHVIDFFGVLMRALQVPGVQAYLGIEYPNDPRRSREPVPQKRIPNLQRFVVWTFGTSEKAAVVQDSRQLTEWGKILESQESLRYLESAPRPRFERAWLKSGGQAESLEQTLHDAADRLEEVTPNIPMYAERSGVKQGVERCALYLAQILQNFGDLRRKYFPKN